MAGRRCILVHLLLGANAEWISLGQGYCCSGNTTGACKDPPYPGGYLDDLGSLANTIVANDADCGDLDPKAICDKLPGCLATTTLPAEGNTGYKFHLYGFHFDTASNCVAGEHTFLHGNFTKPCFISGDTHSCVGTTPHWSYVTPNTWDFDPNVSNATCNSKSVDCDVISSIEGRWVKIGSSSVPADLTYVRGVTHTYQKGNTVEWGLQAEASIKDGFDIKVFSSDVTISGQVSGSFSDSYSEALEMTITKSETFHLTAGVVWQWQFIMVSPCGISTASGTDIALTNSIPEKPCCLPGYSANASMPHGSCLPTSEGKTYNFCTAPSSTNTSASFIKSPPAPVVNVVI